MRTGIPLHYILFFLYIIPKVAFFSHIFYVSVGVGRDLEPSFGSLP
jgi:hypothetical protein